MGHVEADVEINGYDLLLLVLLPDKLGVYAHSVRGEGRRVFA